MDVSKFTPKDIAKYIDHTCVKVDASNEDIKQVCDEAIQYGFHSVCVTPYRVKDVKKNLQETKIAIIAVIGFPFGFTSTATKVSEATEAVSNGATEIDMVININAIKDKQWEFVFNDIQAVVNSIPSISVKVIMETGFLTQEELFEACKVAERAGARFVKTATGYGPRGAELHDISIMKEAIGDRLEIKASGGIHDFETAMVMLESGADRIGSSSGLEIIGVKDKTYKKGENISFNY